jgi:hypothetical protein
MYDRRSFRWPGHSPGEILTFRNQQGTFAQRDLSFLVSEQGNSLISGLEVAQSVDQLPNGTSFIPVHHYLIPMQGVHILEYQNQEELAKDKVYKFAYVLGVNKFRGATAGTALRPIGIA